MIGKLEFTTPEPFLSHQLGLMKNWHLSAQAFHKQSKYYTESLTRELKHSHND